MLVLPLYSLLPPERQAEVRRGPRVPPLAVWCVLLAGVQTSARGSEAVCGSYQRRRDFHHDSSRQICGGHWEGEGL